MKAFTILIFVLFFLHSYPQTAADQVTLSIQDIKGYGEYESFAQESIQRLEQLLNSELFHDEFFNIKMTQTRGYDKTELLDLIFAANELRGNSGTKNTIDIRLRVMSIEKDGTNWMKNCMIDSKASTIGKEADSSGYTVTCQERIEIWAKNKNYGCMAGHIMHEYLHNLGFKHRFYSKRKSFVYKTGILVRNLVNGNSNVCPNE
jgi:hypothetical protein